MIKKGRLAAVLFCVVLFFYCSNDLSGKTIVSLATPLRGSFSLLI